ncbi:MAG: DUF2303 family protein [Miltoncostaeaceae bacterium]
MSHDFDSASDRGDAAVVAEEARRATMAELQLRAIDPEQTLVVVETASNGAISTLILDTERLRTAPRKIDERRTFFTAADLAGYVNRHKGDHTTAWCDTESGRITVILDDHGPGAPAWGAHVAVLSPRLTDEWKRWTHLSGTVGDQTTFAEHIEVSIPEIVEPAGAVLLEIAQTFNASTTTAFRSANRLLDGRVQLRYEQDIDANAGATGELEIPSEFTLALRPFEGSEAFRVQARLRYRMREGKLSIGYVLTRPQDTLEAAIEDMRRSFAEESDLTVWAGQP